MVTGVVEFDVEHTVESTQHPLVQPQTGGATDVFQQQRGLANRVAATDEGFLYVRVVVKIEFAQDLGYDVGGDRLFSAMRIIVF